MKHKTMKDLSNIPVQDLHTELEARKARVRTLMQRYERLLERTNKLRAQIEAQGGFGIGGGGTRIRAKNKISLAKMLQSALAGKSLSVDELTREVVNRGYKSTSPKLRAIINQTLIKHPNFKRVSRGVYMNK